MGIKASSNAGNTRYSYVFVRGLLCLALAITACPEACAESAKEVVQDVVTLLSAGSNKTVDDQVVEAVSKQIDYEYMGEYTLGSTLWNKLNSGQHKEFVETLKTLIEREYYPRWHKIFFRGKLTYLSEVKASKDTFVKTLLTIGNKENIVVWRVRARGGDPRVVSMAVGDKDLLTKVSDRFRDLMEDEDYAGLMEWLKCELDEDAEEERWAQIREREEELAKQQEKLKKEHAKRIQQAGKTR